MGGEWRAIAPVTQQLRFEAAIARLFAFAR
jgi:hypothetical protein